MGAKAAAFNLDFVNYLNILLMLAASALAFYMPFEVLLVSHALLGPLHYLTEISWLHDKKYFVTGKIDPLFLVAPAVPITAVLSSSFSPQDQWVAILIGLTFGAAAGMVLFKRGIHKLLFGIGVFVLMLLLSEISSISMFVVMLLPSVVHIFIFTGAFILLGALKSESPLRVPLFCCLSPLPALLSVYASNSGV